MYGLQELPMGITLTVLMDPPRAVFGVHELHGGD